MFVWSLFAFTCACLELRDWYASSSIAVIKSKNNGITKSSPVFLSFFLYLLIHSFSFLSFSLSTLLFICAYFLFFSSSKSDPFFSFILSLIYVVPSLSFQTFFTGIYNCRRHFKIQYVIAIYLMKWLTNFMI